MLWLWGYAVPAASAAPVWSGLAWACFGLFWLSCPKLNGLIRTARGELPPAVLTLQTCSGPSLATWRHTDVLLLIYRQLCAITSVCSTWPPLVFSVDVA